MKDPFSTFDWIKVDQVFEDSFRLIQEYVTQESEHKVISKINCLQVEVRSSSVPGSGNGIFAKKSFTRGQAISFYPGVYYPPLPIGSIASPDGSFAVDLRPKNQETKHKYDDIYRIYLSSGGFLDTKFSQTSNIGLAHLINHPPKGLQPNVVSYSFYWEEFVQWLDEKEVENSNPRKGYLVKSKIVPLLNEIKSGEPWYLDPNTEEIVRLGKDCSPLVGNVFIACREIKKGEEIFFNYSFKPSKDLPSWYHPVQDD